MRLLRLINAALLGLEKDGVAPPRFTFFGAWDDKHGYELYSLRDQVFFDEPD
jgi:hypothetical protein